MPVIVLPDVERVVIGILNGSADVLALTGGNARAYSVLPDAPTFPLLRVQRAGGSAPFEEPAWLDAGRVQVDSWAETKGPARALAATAEAVLRAYSGIYQAGAPPAPIAVVSSIEETFGLQALEEPDSGRFRYLFEVRVHAHPPA